MNALSSTITELELVDGTKLSLSINFARLLKLRNTRKKDYEAYNKVAMYGANDIEDEITVIYTGYLCNQDDLEGVMDKNEFIEKLPPYQHLLDRTYFSLMEPKKGTDSKKLSGAKPEDQNEE